jgi:large subunit ribosomal protein L24
MKQKFSKHWIGSKQPRKQRKYRANAPNHLRHKLMSANLSKELRKKYEKRSFPIVKDDTVKIMNGEFKGKTGKIEVIDTKKLRASIAGIGRVKKDGAKVAAWFDVSNLQIKELHLEDKKRREALERKEKKSEEGKTEEKKKDNKNKSEEKK